MNIYIEGAHDIIHETSVDFVLRPCSKEVNIVQYDLTLPIVKVNLYKNGERYALPNDVEANVRFGKLDHTFVYKAVLGCNAERNAVYFQVDEQMTLIAGRVSPTIELKWEYNNTTGFANSSPIPVVITRNPIQESDVESSSYAPLFVEVLLQVDDLRERVENMEAVVTHDVVTLYTDQDDITGKKTFKKEIVLGGNVNSRPLLTGILQNGNSSEILTILDVNAVSGTNKGFKLTNIKSISGLIIPTANDQAVNKAYADTKVAKVTSSTTLEQAYTKLAGGAQSMRDISASADNNTIALRTASGTIVVSDPTNPSDAATKRYVDGLISTVYKPQGSATVTQLINLTKTSSMNGYVYNMSNAGTLVDHDGTQLNVLAGDNVVLIWNSGDWYWDKLAGTVDLSPYARKDASNIFSGELNTFNGHVLINGANRYLGVANIINIRKLWYQDQCTTGTCDIEFTQTYIQINKELKNNLIPAVTNTYSIGNSSKQWVDIWFNGSLKDGSGRSLTLEQIAGKYTKPLTGIPSSDLEDIHAVGTNLTKCKITYNSKGLVTNGQDLNYADIPALHTIIPTDNDLYDLGSNTKYWQNAYISRSIKFGSTSNSSLDIIYNINTSDTILTINKDYIRFNKLLTDGTNSITIDQIVNNKSSATNLENGTGTNTIRQKMADATVNFAGRNPNAEALDSSLSAILNTGASGNQSAAFGKNTMALSATSLSSGNKTVAKGEESHAEGYQSVTLGDGSHAEGAQTVAYGLQSHSEGALTQALGDESHAEGHSTIAAGLASHAEGSDNKIGSYSPAANQGANQSGGGGGGGDNPPEPGTFTAGEGSHAEGYSNLIVGFGSHAEGLRNYLTGNYAHVEGVNNTNLANYSHVEGHNNINSGEISHIEGSWNNNSGYNAHIFGHHNANTYDHKVIFGWYNQNKADTILEIGNGTSLLRSNAFEVYQDGHAEVGLMGLTNKSVTTKEYVDTGLNGKVDKVTGKGLSSNDFTTSLKNKLDGIEAGAQVNIIESIKVNDTALTVSSKSVNVNVPLNQTQVCIVADSLHNINGYAVKPSGFSAEQFVSIDTTITTGGKTYTVKIIQYKLGSGTPSNLTEVQAERYMRQMCGSQYVSKYDEDLPHDHIFMMADFTLWKPQWDSTNGLVLWKLSEVQSQLYKHKIYINFYDYEVAQTTPVTVNVTIYMARKTRINYDEVLDNSSLRTYLNDLLKSNLGYWSELSKAVFIRDIRQEYYNGNYRLRVRFVTSDGDGMDYIIDSIGDSVEKVV